MAGTNLVAVKIELDARFRASAGLAGVQIRYSLADDRVVDREWLAFGETAARQRRAASSDTTRVPRNEVADLELMVGVRQLGDLTPQAADQRAAAIGAVIEEIVADNEQMGYNVTALKSVRVATVELANYRDNDGWYSMITYHLTAESHYIR